MDYRIKYLRSIIIIFAVGASGFLTIPPLLVLPSAGLDQSWMLALNIAAANKFQFGKDLVFTFGPFGFLYRPLFCDIKLWQLSLIAHLLAHGLFFFSLVLLMIRSKAETKHYLLLSTIVLIALPLTYIEYKLSVAIIVLLYLSLARQFDEKFIPIILILASSLMAFVSLLKFTALLLSFSIFFVLLFLFIYKGQLKLFLCMVFMYVLSALFLWITAGQRIANLPTYLSNSYEVTHGYDAAMSINGPFSQLFLGLIVIGLFVWMLLISGRERRLNLMSFILISLGFIFVSFKQGFVRHDGHAYIFFANMLVILTILYTSNRKEIGVWLRSLTLILICILAVVIYKKHEVPLMPGFETKYSDIGSALSLATDVSRQKETMEQSKDMMRKTYALNQKTLQYIHDMPVDIFPWETSLAYAYDLKWFPRPVFQSYSAYTAKLDELNARHFQKVNAPGILLYSLRSIDGRYPIFDEPATFRTLLENYRPVSSDGEFIILEKKGSSDSAGENMVLISDALLGKPINIPKVMNGYLFARIYVDYSLLGKLARLFYKPPMVHLYFITGGSFSDRYRFIPANAKNGVFLSQEVNSREDLYNVWNGNLTKNCDAIQIHTSAPIFYKKNIRVEFFTVPKNIKWTSKEEAIRWDKLHKTQGGLFSVDLINGLNLSIKAQPIPIDVSRDVIVSVIGWAVDEKARDAASAVYITLDGSPVARSNYGTDRADVAKYFKVDTYKFSGWKAAINFADIAPGEHKISLRILSRDKRSYYEPADGILIKVRR